MVETIANVSVAGATILFIAGLVDLLMSWGDTKDVKTAVKDGAKQARDVAQKAEESTSNDSLQEYAGLDLSGNWKALAELATALKDLDRSSRLFMISLAFLAVAGATVGLDAIGTGLGK